MIDLNEAQQAAVTAPDGPVLVLAGAGTGKTRVIVERLVWLIHERGLDPRSLLALTFTNRAANEMKTRVAERLQVERLAAWVGTFHSFGLFVLRREIEHLNRTSTFSIFDESDQLSLMRRILRELPPNYAKVSPRDALSWISRLKQDIDEPDFSRPARTDAEETFHAAWRQYHQSLEAACALDFDDLLVLLVKLFREHSDVREKYQRRYRHVLVDEYQDTNHAQYTIARQLTESHGNLFVVGDEDQSIYSWRGAHIRNILDFQKDFQNAQVFRLEQNYRSTAEILAAANAVVKNNRGRLGKTLWSPKRGGDRPRFYLAGRDDDEVKFVLDEIQAARSSNEEQAILYRTNGQARLFEEELVRRGMKYIIVGGIRFYSRKEIKDVLAYMRLIVNPSDDESFRRIINVPARGIGDKTIEILQAYAVARKSSLLDVVREVEHDQSIMARARESLLAFVHLIDDFALEARSHKVAAVLDTIVGRTGYLDYLKQTDEKEFTARVEILDELASACGKFDSRNAGGMAEFLQELVLLSGEDGDEAKDTADRENAVKLLTCHNAKGLEFDSVFLVGLEEGLLPHASALDSDKELEEERRLCYVAMTRARKRLTLTAARSRLMHGSVQDRDASRFIAEMRDHWDLVQRQPEPSGMQARLGNRPFPVRAPAAPQPEQEDNADPQFKLGTRVRHAKFGVGNVVFTSGSGKNLKVRVRFDTGRLATLLAAVANLEIERKRW
jgi:DNA helicase-2/ATP-dependent DNA helicase PcrA